MPGAVRSGARELTTPFGPSPVSEGDVLAGKYRVERVLGAGGMGVVVAALHLELGQRVAIKFLRPEFVKHAEASARFIREARAAVRIQSEHVARVLDVGRLESNAPYLVMEYLEGRDLSAVIQEPEPLPVETALRYVLEASEAVAEAHAAGIVHRDLKPANLFLARRSDGSDSIKVLDFGISKVVAEASEAALTQTSALMGSPLYMSPEQMRSARQVDVRTDIWALGAIIYELIMGVPPFYGESIPEVCAGILTGEPPPMSDRRSDVPGELEAIVRRCLAKDPSQRFQNVAELAHALMAFAPPRSRVSVERVFRVLGMGDMTRTELLPASAIPAPSRTPAPPPRTPLPASNTSGSTARSAESGTTTASWGETQIPARSSRGLWLGLGIAGVIGLGAAAALVFTLQNGKSAVAPEGASSQQATASSVPAAVSPADAATRPHVEPTVAPVEATAPADAASATPPPIATARNKASSARARVSATGKSGAPAKAPGEPSPAAPLPPPTATASAKKRSPLSIDIK